MRVGRDPDRITTEKLGNYAAAKRRIRELEGVEHPSPSIPASTSEATNEISVYWELSNALLRSRLVAAPREPQVPDPPQTEAHLPHPAVRRAEESHERAGRRGERVCVGGGERSANVRT